jgi:hypothetical protein
MLGEWTFERNIFRAAQIFFADRTFDEYWQDANDANATVAAAPLAAVAVGLDGSWIKNFYSTSPIGFSRIFLSSARNFAPNAPSTTR